jgi:uncharacterized membrane protein YbhN (UPF0104 family)
MQFVDYKSVLDQLRLIKFWYVVGAVAAFLMNAVLFAWRYALVIEDTSGTWPGIAKPLRIGLTSLFLTYLLPIAALADLARVAAASRMLSLGRLVSLRCVVHDRILSFVGFAFSAALLLPLLFILRTSPSITARMVFVTLDLIIGCILVGVVAAMTLPSSRSVTRLIEDIVRPFIFHFVGGRRLVRQIGIAAAGTLAFTTQLYILSRALDLDLRFIDMLVFAPWIYLSQVIPFLYGGYGAREVVTVALLGSGLTAPDAAAALGVAVGTTNMLGSLPGALPSGSLALVFLRGLVAGRRDERLVARDHGGGDMRDQ